VKCGPNLLERRFYAIQGVSNCRHLLTPGSYRDGSLVTHNTIADYKVDLNIQRTTHKLSKVELICVTCMNANTSCTCVRHANLCVSADYINTASIYSPYRHVTVPDHGTVHQRSVERSIIRSSIRSSKRSILTEYMITKAITWNANTSHSGREHVCSNMRGRLRFGPMRVVATDRCWCSTVSTERWSQ
jgi:hypothetical protein